MIILPLMRKKCMKVQGKRGLLALGSCGEICPDATTPGIKEI